ncbi:MAG: InlB B-repeat-containing protein [Alphaproteobacteria bacterium]
MAIDPSEGGKIWSDGRNYHPRIPYEPGETVEIKVLPQPGHQFIGWRGDVPEGQRWRMPLTLTVSDAPQEVTACFEANPQHVKDLVFDSDFENGNGIPRYIYRDSRMVVFEPEQMDGADNIWWHCKLHGLTPGECLQIWPLHSSLGDEENIAWAGDCHPVYSTDGVTWQRFDGMRPPYVQRFKGESVEIARNIPYDHTRTVKLAQELAGEGVQRVDLATSRDGLPVVALRFSDPAVDEAGRPVLWIMARQHAFESHASWYAEGLCRWLASDDPGAVALRQRAITYVTPVMDVDAVFKGGSGKEQLDAGGNRADFNRCWGDDSPWPQIRAAKDLLTSLRAEGHPIAAFVDLHNPWYPRPSYWGIASRFAEAVTGFADTFSRCLKETGSGARWKHDLRVRQGGGAGAPGQNDREPTRGTLTSQAWAAQALADGDETLYFLIECSHWKDGYGGFVMLNTLNAYGAALGAALGDWLKGR